MASPITIQVDDGVAAMLEYVASVRGSTVSDVARDAIGESLSHADGGTAMLGARPATLGVYERHLLALSHDVLAHLSKADVREREYHRARAEVLREGYALEYGEEFSAISPEMTSDECRVVKDVLTMFDAIKASLRRLTPHDRERLLVSHGRTLRFRGFDGSDWLEGRMQRYAEFLLREQWNSLMEDWVSADNGNSQAPMLATYRRQLEEFQPRWESRVRRIGLSSEDGLLSTDELEAIATASTPEARIGTRPHEASI